jgi:hypothetical protein
MDVNMYVYLCKYMYLHTCVHAYVWRAWDAIMREPLQTWDVVTRTPLLWTQTWDAVMREPLDSDHVTDTGIICIAVPVVRDMHAIHRCTCARMSTHTHTHTQTQHIRVIA